MLYNHLGQTMLESNPQIFHESYHSVVRMLTTALTGFVRVYELNDKLLEYKSI